ncbi:ABC transporter substrate-binding protein [Psychromonas sp. KJ10-10]|uniref:ABC transporter substrate-binding protein n=1 Tax=Psychromonas sp. KJ10-10 TaxID=3391823 RepID=UPI0039B6B902
MYLCHQGEREAKSFEKSFDLILPFDISIFYRNAFISFIILIFTALPLTLKAQQSETVAIVAPMVGHSFSIGIQFKAGVTAAIDALPDKKLLGKSIHIKTFDDKCNTLIAEKIANNVVNYSPVVVIGHSCSMATVKVAPIYDHHNILQITPSSTQPKVTELGINSIFRMIGRDDVQGEIAETKNSSTLRR